MDTSCGLVSLLLIGVFLNLTTMKDFELAAPHCNRPITCSMRVASNALRIERSTSAAVI